MSIETWEARLEKVEDGCIVTNAMVQTAMTDEIDELRAKLETLETEKAEREKQEPVAWLSVDSIGERYLCFSKPEDGDEVHPLYLFAETQPRVPMTKDEMADMFKAVGIDGYDEREKLVRAVEAHHKIGVQP